MNAMAALKQRASRFFQNKLRVKNQEKESKTIKQKKNLKKSKQCPFGISYYYKAISKET